MSPSPIHIMFSNGMITKKNSIVQRSKQHSVELHDRSFGNPCVFVFRLEAPILYQFLIFLINYLTKLMLLVVVLEE